VAKAKKGASTKKTTKSREMSGGKAAAATKKAASSREASVDRRNSSRDRRQGTDRRKANEPVAVERRKIERRVKVNRRRQIDPTTCERDYTPEELEFMNALDDYKRTSGRMFPTCSEVLEVIRNLGYQKRPEGAPDSPPAAEQLPA
jgi:hypothetical protein